MLKVDLLDHGDLAPVHLWIEFEHHVFLLLLAVVYDLVLLEGLIGGVRGSDVCSGQSLVDLDSLTDLLQDVVDLKGHHDLALGGAHLEELVLCHLSPIPEQVYEN